MSNPHDVTRAFEFDLCAYTGAPYAVAVNSCTMAILLACGWWRHSIADGIAPGQLGVSLPKLTYVGAAMSAMHAGFAIAWRDENWQGEYQLEPLPVWDAARRFTENMYQNRLSTTNRGAIFQCVSFHSSKILSHSQGGAILHGDAYADKWLRRARFDGRSEDVPPKDDFFNMLGWHCYMSPDVAAALRWKLASLPLVNADLPRSDYPDLSLHPVFGGSGLAEQPANV